MENIAQQLAVIDPGSAWLLPIPLDGFTMPKFSFGQKVMSQSRETIGRIIGMEFVPSGSHYISCGWRYVIATNHLPDFRNWGNEVDSNPEADLIINCGGEN
jgi:hypothetical protein